MYLKVHIHEKTQVGSREIEKVNVFFFTSIPLFHTKCTKKHQRVLQITYSRDRTGHISCHKVWTLSELGTTTFKTQNTKVLVIFVYK